MDNEEFAAELKESATTMMAAANRTHQAVVKFDEASAVFMQFLDGWLDRLEKVTNNFETTEVKSEAPNPDGGG